MSSVKELKKEIHRLMEEAKKYDPGSEEYANCAKAAAILANAVNRLDKLDWVALAKDGTMIVLFALLLIFNMDHILDSKVVNVFRNFFRLA